MQIKPSKIKIAVCGLGYVGYPVALLFAKAGFQVTGVRRNEELVKKINRGISPIEGKEPGLKELARQVKKSRRFVATTDASAYRDADIIIVAVETPVESDNHEPAYAALRSALSSIGRNMKEGVLVIIESTIAPGTMDNVVKPTLEEQSGMIAAEEFLLAHCPERVRPGRLLENIQNYNRVLGGTSQASSELAKKLYRYIVKAEISQTDCVTAEVVKTGENTYRDVQIAFANELALLCEAMGANAWEVRKLINECKRADRPVKPEDMLQVHFPGPGVGGHCLPKDPWLLVYAAKGLIEPKLIPLARQINDFMPRHTFDLAKEALENQGKTIENTKVAVLGYAYAGGSDDTRNTPSEPLLSRLHKAGAKVAVHDPYVKEYQGHLEKVLKGAQVVIIMAGHDQYKKTSLKKIKRLMRSRPILVDGRNVFDKVLAQKSGFIYKGVGNI